MSRSFCFNGTDSRIEPPKKERSMEKTLRSDVENRSAPESSGIGSKTYGTVSADKGRLLAHSTTSCLIFES